MQHSESSEFIQRILLLFAFALQVRGLLGLWSRAPYLHDGCAETLEARFTRCDTGQHGNVKDVSAEDLQALVAYLETL